MPATSYVTPTIHHDLLTPEQEQTLLAAIRRDVIDVDAHGRRFITVQQAIRQGSPGQAAYETLLAHNRALVASICAKYAEVGFARGLEFDDLLQLGSLGLHRAAMKYDPTKRTAKGTPHKFSTYAVHWIRQFVLRGIADDGDIIRRPNHVAEAMMSQKEHLHRFVLDHGREPTPEELAALSGCTLAVARAALRGRTVTVDSLDRVVKAQAGGRRDRTLADYVAADQPDLADLAAEREKVEVVARAIHRAHLTPQEQRVVALRYGLGGERTHTLQEVGDVCGFTRERARQVEEQIKAKLRPYLAQYAGGAA